MKEKRQHKVLFSISGRMAYVVVAFLVFCVCLPLIPQNQNVWSNPIIELVEKKESDSESDDAAKDDQYKFDDFMGWALAPLSQASSRRIMPDLVQEFHLLIHPDINTPPPKQA